MNERHITNITDSPGGQPETPRLTAILDTSWVARLECLRPLTFGAPNTKDDIPGHVRAGSAVRLWGYRLVVVQDDVHALALLDERVGVAVPLMLPAGEDGRRSFEQAAGNKALKMDLEACFTLPDGRLIALGSGSTPRRENVVVVAPNLDVRIVDGRTFYAQLRARTEFMGSELNVEGAVVMGETLRLFQRGNGTTVDGKKPVHATGDVSLAALVAWIDGAGTVPTVNRVQQFDLGEISGVPFGFTDATTLPDGRVVFLAGAEDSPDTFQDGTIVGCRVGFLDGDDIHMIDIQGENGEPTPLKLEGIDWVREREGGGWEFVVVADMDDPNTAAILATLIVVPNAGGILGGGEKP